MLKQPFNDTDFVPVGQLFINRRRSSHPRKLDIRRWGSSRYRPSSDSLFTLSIRFHSLNGIRRKPDFNSHVAPPLPALVIRLSILWPTPPPGVATRHGARLHRTSSPLHLPPPARADDRIIGPNAASRSRCLMGLLILPRPECCSGTIQRVKRARSPVSA